MTIKLKDILEELNDLDNYAEEEWPDMIADLRERLEKQLNEE